ncbi:hypothetical protein [Kitasatospora phosalacinea]|nr:hypothetical protein [Kitasatospora phosalacinea]
MDALKGLNQEELLASVFTPKSGPGDVLTVGTVEKAMLNGNHRAHLLKAAADHHRRTDEGIITWDTPICIRNYEQWAD